MKTKIIEFLPSQFVFGDNCRLWIILNHVYIAVSNDRKRLVIDICL